MILEKKLKSIFRGQKFILRGYFIVLYDDFKFKSRKIPGSDPKAYSTNPYRFSSEYHDDETDLVYYNYRYYSPSLGRWLSRDPIGEDGGYNLYGMIGNDGVNSWDSLGFWEVERNGNKRALVIKTSESDSLESLAKLVRLDKSDAKKWLYDENHKRIKNWDPSLPDCKYSVPNTLFILLGDHLGTAALTMVGDARIMNEKFTKAGFNVIFVDAEDNSADGVMDKLGNYSYDMWGFAYFGHGFVGHTGVAGGNPPPKVLTKKLRTTWAPGRGFAAYKNEGLSIFGMNVPLIHRAIAFMKPSIIKQPFKRGLISILACYSNEGKGDDHWKTSVSGSGKLFTVNGIDFAPFGYANFAQASGKGDFFKQAIPPKSDIEGGK